MIVGELEQFVRWAKSLDGPYTPPNGPYQPFPFFPIPNPGVVNIFDKNEAVGTTPRDSDRCEAIIANHFLSWMCMKRYQFPCVLINCMADTSIHVPTL